MSIFYAQAAGNASEIAFNTAANGSGDAVAWGDMLETDDVESNNFAVELDVASFVRNYLQTLNGGGFTVNLAAVGNRTFTCNLVAGTTRCLLVTGTTYTLSGLLDVTGGSGAGSHAIDISSAATVTLRNVTGGSGSGGVFGVYARGGGTIAVTDTCKGGAETNASGVYVASAATVNVKDVTNGTNKFAAGVNQASASSTITISGEVDLTQGQVLRYASTASSANPFRFARSARFKVLAADGVTPIYFRPANGRGLMTGGAI